VADLGTEPFAVAPGREDEVRDRALAALVVGVEQLDAEQARGLHGLDEIRVLGIVAIADRGQSTTTDAYGDVPARWAVWASIGV